MKDNWLTKIAMVVALFLAYMKTAEAMVHFAPKMFLGWTDPILPVLWGYVCAGLVEGLALYAFSNLISNTKDTPTRSASIAVTFVAVSFSIVMNVIDQQINDGSFNPASGVPIVGFLFTLMGLIPILTGILFGLLRIVDAYFPDYAGGKQKPKGGSGWEVMPQRQAPQAAQPPRGPSQTQISIEPRQPAFPNYDPMQVRASGNGSAVKADARSFENVNGPMGRLVEAGEVPTPPRA